MNEQRDNDPGCVGPLLFVVIFFLVFWWGLFMEQRVEVIERQLHIRSTGQFLPKEAK